MLHGKKYDYARLTMRLDMNIRISRSLKINTLPSLEYVVYVPIVLMRIMCYIYAITSSFFRVGLSIFRYVAWTVKVQSTRAAISYTLRDSKCRQFKLKQDQFRPRI